MTQKHNIASVLSAVSGSSFIGIDTEVDVKLTGGKSNPQQGRVTKRTTGSRCQVFQNKGANGYANMVHRRLAAQLQRQAAERAAEAKNLLSKDLSPEQVEELAGSIDQFLAEADNLGKAKGLFQLSPRKWGERIPGTPFVRHTKEKEVNPNFYLEVIFLKGGDSEYFLDGQPIAASAIQGLPRTERKEGAQIQGGLEAADQVIVRSYAVESIVGIRAAGQEFQGDFYYA